MPDGFEILYEVGPCLVLRKPAGVLTQAPPGIDSLETRLRSFLQVRDDKSPRMYLGIPHRLDRPVSGCIVFARHVRAAHRLAEQFEARTVRKTYWACVSGQVEPTTGTWVDHVRKIPGQAHAECVPAEHPEAREAILHFTVRGQFAWGTWLEIALGTGRMHQIRVQAAARGFPILGDVQYGSPVPFGTAHADPRDNAIALHARELGFWHPMTRDPVAVVAELSDAWNSLELNI